MDRISKRDALLLLAVDTNDDQEFEDYMVAYCLPSNENELPSMKTAESFKESDFKALSRFERVDLLRLRKLLRIPDAVKLNNGSTIDGDTALLITTRRLAYPCRLKDLSLLFGRSVSDLSRCVEFVTELLFERWQHLLEFHESRFGAEKLHSYAMVLQRAGCPIPNCVGFIDGTFRPICRPGRSQELLFSGHKRCHGLKFQSVITADGLISHLSGPYCGCRHDSAILLQSGLMDYLQRQFRVDQTHYLLYGDGGYAAFPHLLSPFK